MNVIYNGVDAWEDLSENLEGFTYTDAVGESDSISFTLADRDLMWSNSWMPQKGDRIEPFIILENWMSNDETNEIDCGSFLVDDFSFSSPPVMSVINGVSAPVHTDFKETDNTKTWENATLKLIATEIAAKYGLELNYEAGKEIPIKKTEQSSQTDCDFLKQMCEKYGLGLKFYSDKIIIWDFADYFSRQAAATITPKMTSRWSYNSTMQGTYTGARVSYKPPKSKKAIDVMVGTEGRVYKTTQKADSEADARLLGESAMRNANRKESTMKLTLVPDQAIYATQIVSIEDFGGMDGLYFVEKVSHQVSHGGYTVQLELSKIPGDAQVNMKENRDSGNYTVQKGDSLWSLAKRFYEDPSKDVVIYQANSDAIEEDAKKHGKSSSKGGYWIYPGLLITIP